jgi:ATP-dependent helicase/nuclease subunit A
LLNKSIEGFFIAVFAKFSGKYSINEIKEFSAIFPIIEEYNKISSSCNFEGFIMFFEKLIRQKESFKLEKNSSENAVKISTVHASKGLESPIIFILNATEVFSKMEARENLIFNEENQIFLLSKKKLFCEKWLNAKEKEKSTKYAEYIRLFYVALTRAKEEIYIFPKKLPKTVKEREESWYEIAQSTLPDCILSSNNAKFKEEITIIEQIPHTFVKIPQIPQTLQIREKATENIANSKFTQTGSVIHEMLEGVEFKFKLEYFLQKFSFLNEKEIITLYNKSLKIRTKFPFLFTQNTFSEVEIIQEIGKNSIFSGKIDKIIISSEILIYDFKLQKNPKLLQKTHTQLEKYKIAMAKIYPKHAIKCFILWINSEEIEEITHFLQTDEMHLQLF